MGTIELVKVSDLSKMSSPNGVFFTSGDAETAGATGGVEIRCRALEISNVNREHEQQLLQHFQQVQTFE